MQNPFGSNLKAPTDAWLLGAQGGGTWKPRKNVSLTVAPTFYTYVNAYSGEAGTTNVGTAFSPTLAGGNNVGINHLNVFDVPVEMTFPAAKFPASIFGELAVNLTGDARARAAGYPQNTDDVYAYRIGASLGAAKKKGDWLVKSWWQHTDLFALDPNLVDSDLFDARLNMEGVVVSGQYQFTDFLFGTLTYGHAETANKSLPTLTGAGDLGGNLRRYNLFQADVNWKF